MSKTTIFSDIDLECWRDYVKITTDSLWLFDSRDKTGGHQLDYHGNFIPQIATQIFTRYTHKNDIVVDLFLGSGTSAIEAARRGRHCIGVDLRGDLVEYVRAKLLDKLMDIKVRVLQGDSCASGIVSRIKAILRAWGQTHAQLIMLHPPYHDIIRFSDLPADLSNAPNTEVFLDWFSIAAHNAYALLEAKRFACLVIGDKYAKGELIPLGFLCMQEMINAGFRTKAIIVKDIQGNEKAKGRAANLWRYRALAGGFYIFKHEYVIVFQKPS